MSQDESEQTGSSGVQVLAAAQVLLVVKDDQVLGTQIAWNPELVKSAEGACNVLNTLAADTRDVAWLLKQVVRVSQQQQAEGESKPN